MANHVLANRLLSARRAAGISTRTLAKQLNQRGCRISHATIANYERGDTIPPLTTVAAIAQIFDFSMNWFLQADGILTGVCYRALKRVSMRDKRAFEGLAQRWLEGYRRLECRLGQGLGNDLDDFISHQGESGKMLAERLRVRLGLHDGPIPSVIEVLHRFGIRVLAVDSPPGIDGLAAQLDEEPVVVLTSRLSNDRIRLNAAHELGHHLCDIAQPAEIATETDREALAFEFGSYFLMPSSRLKEAFEGYSMLRLIEHKRQFGISLAAMIYRAKRDSLMSETVYRMLWREFAKRGWRKAEPGEVVADRPQRFEQMLEGAVQTGALTWAQAAKTTKIRESELRARVAAAMGVSVSKNEEICNSGEG